VSSETSGRDTKKKLSPALLFLRDAGIAIVFVASILLAMYAYTGLWPPLVVVESNSMMHSEDTSYVGVIDTGDLVLVKSVGSASDIETYMSGYSSGHKTYGDYGDVIIYKVNGNDIGTPIIHRAIVYLEANADGESFRCEDLRDVDDGKWTTSNPSDTWDRLTSVLRILEFGYQSETVTIDTTRLVVADGFITKGDHNDNVDQSLPGRNTPVKTSWVVGKARGEIPWFGLLKLWSTDSLKSEAPENSVRNLWISLALIVIGPILADVVVTYKIRKKIARKREAAIQEYEAEKKNMPPEPEPPEPEPEDQPPGPPQEPGGAA
jgi:signal peptidase